jgi:hypothetical protein
MRKNNSNIGLLPIYKFIGTRKLIFRNILLGPTSRFYISNHCFKKALLTDVNINR